MQVSVKTGDPSHGAADVLVLPLLQARDSDAGPNCITPTTSPVSSADSERTSAAGALRPESTTRRTVSTRRESTNFFPPLSAVGT